ncbi:MAG: hypothetical protein AAGE52_15585 [Myxococcota bacterium]
MIARTCIVLLVSALALPACGGGGYAVQSEQVFLLTNLHADGRRVVWSVNYTNPPGSTTLPICTPVSIDRIGGREIRFTTLNNRVRYRYVLHRSARAPLQQHLQRHFGSGCPNIATMSPEDQSGIQQGQIYQGMTKQGVLMAVGYPPEHRTPSLDGDVWRYWSSRFGQFEVYFTNGVVSGIRN